ncbi:MAG: hypothetical protein COZ06_00910 [Armatimonadetes bacterium CG_4_10_14_3_um_filter_66_18]|nr:hypothetical protein [Armatimonadota bacterium]OIO94314.1 MAG: hypothetical protein AUJ96_28840 [Armatimonadetes bacterium CG2_30_66_41]PIU89024.1 MAG: hypothetical protein COS65_29585 [Armatimonadetes bacterium CG06_land_8_20_14_3_00_66_21]PIX37102.1 MAG: hypothetical protein COZ57_36150 [Armatimonadetes bacterium CG_4_8_14_3_um_filter_66_20]PIY53900.1 MAG: hypothetical protein COZ06_00910 [Armatimonadetes bacterium CG_4_10_14_3_um_filter_66_18]PJB62871.1 MAG: hypothetical protein CO096_24
MFVLVVRVHSPARRSGLALATLLLAADAFPGAQAAERALTYAAHTSAAPSVDGLLTEAVWRNAPRVEFFSRLTEGYQAAAATHGRLLWDDECLYVGVRCDEPEMAKVAGLTSRRDAAGIGADDCLELLLARTREGPVYHLIVNVIGALYDEAARGAPAGWDSRATVQTSISEAFWEAELRLPFAALGGSPAFGDRWSANLCRCRAQGEERSSWSGARGSFLAPDQLGTLLFGGTVPTFAWESLGDEFGELVGGAVVRGEVYNPGALPVQVTVRANVVDAAGDVAVLQQRLELDSFAVRPVSLSYRKQLRAPQALRLEASAPAGPGTFLVTPRLELRPRFLLPRVDWLRDRFVAALGGATPESATALQEQLRRLTAVEQGIDALEQPSVERWESLNDRLTALAAAGPAGPSTALAGPSELTPSLAPSKLVGGSSYVLFPVYPFERLLYDTPPQTEAVGQPMHVSGCRGEREPASFVLSAIGDLTEVAIQLSDLVGENGVIPQRYLSARIVKCWPQLLTGAKGDRAETVPELLMRDDRVDLAGGLPSLPGDAPVVTDVPGGTSKQVWLTVQIPEKAAPGVYVGNVTVQPGHGASASIALQVRVLPFVLPPAPRWLVLGHRAVLSSDTGPLARTEELYARELRDILDHGFRYVAAVEQGDRLEACLDVRWRLGMSGLFPYFPQMPSAQKAREVRRAVSKGPGWTLLFGPPELGMEAHAPAAIESLGFVRETQGATTGLVTLADAAETSHPVDLPVYSVDDPGFVVYAKSLVAGAKPRRARELYTWDCTQEDPNVNRLFCGYYLFKSGFQGALASDYQDLAATDSPYAETEVGARCRLLTYPTQEGPLPTVQWEAAREGIDDLRYVLLLERSLAQSVAAADPQTGPARETATAFLAQLRATIQLDHGAMLSTLRAKRLQELRWDCVRLLLALRQEVQSPPPVRAKTIAAQAPAL